MIYDERNSSADAVLQKEVGIPPLIYPPTQDSSQHAGNSLWVTSKYGIKGHGLNHLDQDYFWLVVSTHLKNISQNGNLPQLGVNINKNLKPPPRFHF